MTLQMVCRDDEEVAGPDEEFSHLEQHIADAQERQDTATKQFTRLCSICIAAQQACPTQCAKIVLESRACYRCYMLTAVRTCRIVPAEHKACVCQALPQHVRLTVLPLSRRGRQCEGSASTYTY